MMKGAAGKNGVEGGGQTKSGGKNKSEEPRICRGRKNLPPPGEFLSPAPLYLTGCKNVHDSGCYFQRAFG